MELSRVEHILKYFLGEADTLPQPLSRVEELLIALGELISSGAVSSPIKIKGRVDTVYDLPSNAEPGWMYYVGPASASEFAEYVYLDSGEWQYTGTSNSAIDIALSTTSTNPVENRVITEAINLINQTLSNKVDKVTGKGLSTEDFTTEEKAKLSSIETGANANVQADWNQTDNSADDFIKNKPTIPDPVVVDQAYNALSANAQSGTAVAGALDDKVDKVAGKGLSTEDFTTAEKAKLYNIESGAQANVQVDWNQTDDTADDFIKNKPDITFVQVNADWNATSGVAQILNKPNIPEGVIVDLVYDPTSEHAQAGVAVAEAISNKVDKVNGKGLSTNDFTDNNKTKLDSIAANAEANVQSDWNQNDSTADDFIKNKPTIPAAQVNSDWEATSGKAQILNKPILSAVATTGSYDDLSDKPTIPAAQVNSDWDAVSGIAQILNKPSLSTVATTGSYNDLINKPTIPTVNNATLEIQKNRVKVGEFSSDASSDVTVNITVPVDAADVNALPDTTKYASSIDVSINNTTYVMTTTLKDQDGNTLGTAQVVDLPLETMVVGGSYDDATHKIVLTLNNGTTVDFSVADLVSGLQSEITSNSKLSSDLVDDTTSVHKFVTAADKTAWNAKSDFSGSYNDLTDKPTIPAAQVNADWNSTSGVSEILNKPTFSTVATSGSYNDLADKPSIPAAQVNADWTATSGVAQILNKPTLATVATSGSYNDLSNKPTIPTVDQTYDSVSTNAQSGTAVAQALQGSLKMISASNETATGYLDLTNEPISVFKNGEEVAGISRLSDLASVQIEPGTAIMFTRNTLFSEISSGRFQYCAPDFLSYMYILSVGVYVTDSQIGTIFEDSKYSENAHSTLLRRQDPGYITVTMGRTALQDVTAIYQYVTIVFKAASGASAFTCDYSTGVELAKPPTADIVLEDPVTGKRYTVEQATVDQTYDSTSANPQSGVAIAGVIGNINSVLEEVL